MKKQLMLAVGLNGLAVDQVNAIGDSLSMRVVAVDHAADARPHAKSCALIVCAVDEFDALHADWPRVPKVVIATFADSRRTINAMKRGAVDCLLIPTDQAVLHAAVTRGLSADDTHTRAGDVTMRTGSIRESAMIGAEDGVIGQSPAMQEVYKQVGLIATADVNVLITGESGTGKEVIANAIHDHSPRAAKPIVAVNCAAIPETLLESELFGHEKGAFTGADERKVGKFEQAQGGTVLLDEIGDMPLATQVKLLRVLQDKRFHRLGGDKLVECDVRIIAATHQPLEELVKCKTFREDLYYRLKVVTVQLPPLRDREVDCVLLAHFFVDRFNADMGTHIRTFSPEAVSALLRYPWPGNVRELENVIKASLLGARGAVFQADFLPDHVRQASPPPQTTPQPGVPARVPDTQSDATPSIDALAREVIANPDHRGDADRVMVDHAHRALIIAALNATKGQLGEAAALLGISRTTLRARIRKLGIETHIEARAGE